MKSLKKTGCVFLICFLIVMASACGAGEPEEQVPYEIAMLSNTGSIEDGSFNQSVWRGIEAFVEEEPVSYKSYLTTEDSTDAFLRTIHEAVEGGAHIIIAAGSTFGEAIFQAQEEYPEISFVLMDGQPQGQDPSDIVVDKNTVAVLFAEEQAGFLAGYGAVKEDYRNLGFMGGKELDSVKRFGYGFIQGAQKAAEEQGAEVQLRYTYTGTFSRNEAVEQKAADWYAGGTEVIFACAGDAGKSVMKAAEAKGGNVIGVDTDQSEQSETVLVSAVKNLDESVGDILRTYYCEDEFAGGQTIRLNAENLGIGLSMASSRMKNFTDRDYDEIFRALAEGEITVKGDDAESIKELDAGRVTVKEEK